MADPNPTVTIRATEQGVVRVFAMNMPAQQAQFQRDPAALEQILGVADIDATYVEIFPVGDLEQLGLVGYLSEGCGVPPETIAPHRDRLNAVTGYVMIVFSRAFGGRAVTLSPDPTLTLIASLHEPGPDWSGDAIESDSAKLYSSNRQTPRQVRAETRRGGAIVFTVFMVVVAVVILAVLL